MSLQGWRDRPGRLLMACAVMVASVESAAQAGARPSTAETARQLRDQRRAGGAQEVLDRVARLPGEVRRDPRVLGEELQALLDAGRFDEAVARSADASAIDGRLPVPLAVALTRLQFRRGDLEGAAHNVERMLATLPGHHDLRVLELRLALAGGRHAEAQRALAELRPALPEGLARELEGDLLLGRAAEMMGSDELLDQALALLDRARGLDPDRADVTGLYVRALARFHRADTAEELVRGALERAEGRDRTELLYALGFVLRHTQRDAEANEVFLQVLEREPGHGKARLGLARGRLAEGDLDGAREQVQDVLRADPSDLDALALLSEIACDEGDWEAAAAPLEALLEIKPRHLKGLWMLSRVRARQGRRDEVASLVARYELRKGQFEEDSSDPR